MKNIDDDGKISKDSNQYARLWRLSRIRLAECSDDNSRNLNESISQRNPTYVIMFLKIRSFRSKINEIEIEYSSQKFSIYF